MFQLLLEKRLCSFNATVSAINKIKFLRGPILIESLILKKICYTPWLPKSEFKKY